MEDNSGGPKPYELRIAGVASIATISVLTAFLLLAPVSRPFVLALAYAGLILSTAYGLNRFYAFSRVGSRKQVNDPDYLAEADLFVLAVITPPLIYICFELRDIGPVQYDWVYVLVYLLIISIFIIAIAGLVSTTYNSFSLFSWLSVPLSVGTFVLLLGDSRAFGFFSHAVPNKVFDMVEVSRWAAGTVLGAAILLHTVTALFAKSGAFIEIARRWSSLTLMTKAASTATGLYRVAVSTTILFLTVGKYVGMAAEMFWVFFSTILEALFNAARSFLNWRRLVVSISVCLLILSGISIAVEAPTYVIELDRSLTTTDYDTELFLRFCGFMAWVAAFGLAHALICYRRAEELVSSVVLVITMVACGVWVGAFIFRALGSAGAIEASGYSLAMLSWFFLFVLAIAPLGGVMAWWHVVRSKRQTGAAPPVARSPEHSPLPEACSRVSGRQTRHGERLRNRTLFDRLKGRAKAPNS